MFHVHFMPFLARKRERPALVPLVAAVILLFAAVIPVNATDRPRVASINVCTDQLLLALADPEQIVGLSPYSRDAARSWAAADARRYPLLSGEAEDVLILKPDAIVAGRFTKRATRDLLKAKGLRVIEFDAARTIEEAKIQIRRMGDLLGYPERAAASIAALDAAVTRAQTATANKRYRVLAVSRRGWVSGSNSLTSSLLAIVGLTNAAGEMGNRGGGFATLEAIVANRPDFILVTDDSLFAEDQGRAFLLHPALEKLYPAEKRFVIPERLTVCGGPMLAEAIDQLASEIERASH